MAVNCVGDIYDAQKNRLIAGALGGKRHSSGGEKRTAARGLPRLSGFVPIKTNGAAFA
jgi:hypothetical protein